MTVETVIDKEHLREEMLRTARSFPQSFPVILESFENDSSNTPDVKTFTSDEIDQYIEIVQEFSRERFPEEAKRQAELRAMREMREESLVKERISCSSLKVSTSPIYPKVTTTFVRETRRRKSPPKTSTNRKGLRKRSRSRRAKRKRHNKVPFLSIPLENIPMDQLYSFSEYTLEEDKNLPDNSVDFSTLPKSGPYTELHIPQIRARLLNEFSDMLSGCPEALPPL